MIPNEIRKATASDSEGVAALLAQLGYPADPAAMPGRIQLLGDERATLILVAQQATALVGLATGHLFHSVHAAEPIAYLTTLVVDREARNRGIGRSLVDKVAEWAGRLGAARLSAATGTQRTESHRIYERLGFERTGFRYSRSLAKQPL